jgi:hypothetical protein
MAKDSTTTEGLKDQRTTIASVFRRLFPKIGNDHNVKPEFAPWGKQNSRSYARKNYGGNYKKIWDADAILFPLLRQKLSERLRENHGDNTTTSMVGADLVGADLGAGPSPLGGLILDGVGVSQIKLLEYAAPHRHYLEELFTKKRPWQSGRWRKIWDKYEPFTGGHLPNMSPEIGKIDLHAPAENQLNCFDAITSLTVLESMTSREADFHKVFLNALDTLKGGGIAAMTFMAGSQDWTDGKGHKYPAAGVSFERIKAAIEVIDSEAWVHLVPRVAADGRSDYEGIMGAVFTKHSQYDRPLIEHRLQKLRAQESIENHRTTAASAASVRGAKYKP